MLLINGWTKTLAILAALLIIAMIVMTIGKIIFFLVGAFLTLAVPIVLFGSIIYAVKKILL